MHSFGIYKSYSLSGKHALIYFYINSIWFLCLLFATRCQTSIISIIYPDSYLVPLKALFPMNRETYHGGKILGTKLGETKWNPIVISFIFVITSTLLNSVPGIREPNNLTKCKEIYLITKNANSSMYSWDLFLKSMIQTVVFQTKRWTDSLDKQHTDYNHMQIDKKIM